TKSVSDSASNVDSVGIRQTSSISNCSSVACTLSRSAGGRFAIDGSSGVVTVANASLLNFETATSHDITVKAADASGAFTTQTFRSAERRVGPEPTTDITKATYKVADAGTHGRLAGA